MMMKLKFEIVIVRVKNPTSRIANYFLHTDTVMVYRPSIRIFYGHDASRM